LPIEIIDVFRSGTVAMFKTRHCYCPKARHGSFSKTRHCFVQEHDTVIV